MTSIKEVIFIGPTNTTDYHQFLIARLPTAYYVLPTQTQPFQWDHKLIRDCLYRLLSSKQLETIIIIGYQTLDRELRAYLGRAKHNQILIIHVNDDDEYEGQVRKGEMWYDHPTKLFTIH